MGRTLATTIGMLVQRERVRRELTQAKLAALAGTSQQWLSRLERGETAPSTTAVERVFEVLGLQPRLEVEPLGTDLDPEIDRYQAMNEEDRHALLSGYLWRIERLGDLPYVLSGRVAAFVQGAPVAMPWLDLAVARSDLDGIAEWLERVNCRRWNEHWLDWGYGEVDPREPGPMRWLIGVDEIRLELHDRRPTALTVQVRERELRVRPLWELERDFDAIGRLMRRVRARAASPGAG
jgi:transcriptional regulator with XRE-family HTH domain